MSKMTLLLKELDCPHCAEKIEKRVGELSSVKSSNLDFINKKLTVDFDGDKNALFTEIENVVHKLEPDVSVKELGDCAEKTLYLKLEDLDCPNCGEKVSLQALFHQMLILSAKSLLSKQTVLILTCVS